MAIGKDIRGIDRFDLFLSYCVSQTHLPLFFSLYNAISDQLAMRHSSKVNTVRLT